MSELIIKTIQFQDELIEKIKRLKHVTTAQAKEILFSLEQICEVIVKCK